MNDPPSGNIEVFYNRQRWRTSIGSIPPVTFKVGGQDPRLFSMNRVVALG